MTPQDYLERAAFVANQVDPHLTSPNPRVGCIVVKDNKIVAEGIHEKFGSAHAEVQALSKNIDYKDCEVFISLEPCHIFPGKKTPSCTNLLLNLQPKKVYVGSLDPQFKGQNIEHLQSLGIDIQYLPNKACKELNPFFKTWITEKKPYITLKIAQSLNGRITSKDKYITNNLSRDFVHQMRAQYSALLTTTKTILKDDPLLDCRLESFHRPYSNPVIIILGKQKLPKNLKVFQIPGRKIYYLKNLGDLYAFCREKNIDSIMTECGTTLNSLLLKKKLVDQIEYFIAPHLLNHQEKSTTNTEIKLDNFRLTQTSSLNQDLHLTYQRLD